MADLTCPRCRAKVPTDDAVAHRRTCPPDPSPAARVPEQASEQVTAPSNEVEFCHFDACPATICAGPHVGHYCPNGDLVVRHRDIPRGCPFCGASADEDVVTPDEAASRYREAKHAASGPKEDNRG